LILHVLVLELSLPRIDVGEAQNQALYHLFRRETESWGIISTVSEYQRGTSNLRDFKLNRFYLAWRGHFKNLSVANDARHSCSAVRSLNIP